MPRCSSRQSNPQGGESRRSSNITCCSTESSYLERRCSAVTLGLPSLPLIATPAPSRRTTRTAANQQSHNDHQPMDLFAGGQPGIQVIRATPRTSPSGSQRNSRERQEPAPPPPPPSVSSSSHAPPLSAQTQLRSKSLSLEHQPRSLDSITVYTSSASSDEKLVSVTAGVDDRSSMMMMAMMSDAGSRPTRSRGTPEDGPTAMATTTFSCSAPQPSAAPNARAASAAAAAGAAAGLRRAPLASISSFKISSVDYQDSDLKSLGSDSVFAESFYADTDDELEPFSTDSDELTTSDEKRASPRHANVPPVASQQPASTTTCSTVNETAKPPPAHAASRRILQRSSTIYPSSESLPKQPGRSCTIETIATIEPRSSASPAAAAARADGGCLEHSTPPSTRSLPPAMRPVRPAAASAPARRARTTTPPASTSRAAAGAGGAGIADQPHPQTTPGVPGTTYNHSSASSASSNSCRSRHAAMRRTEDAALADSEAANVRLEMPVIAVTEAAGAGAGSIPAPLDPSVPAGTARKWSRETLF